MSNNPPRDPIAAFETFCANLRTDIALVRGPEQATFSKRLADLDTACGEVLGIARRRRNDLDRANADAAELSAQHEEEDRRAAAAEAERVAAEAKRKAEQAAKVQEANAKISERKEEFQRALSELADVESRLRPIANAVFDAILQEAEGRGVKIDGTLLTRKAAAL